MNDPEFHRRAMQLFNLACDLPAGERESMLDRECADDPDLRAKVERMLIRDSATGVADLADSGGAADQLAVELTRAAPNDEGMPAMIGAYRIVRRIGHGGMGIIYEAEQESPRRRVALKVLQAGVMNPGMLRRFQREAQVLGQLQHPGIAQVYEAGLADLPHGRQPFFAMEFIDGLPLDRHAESKQLSNRQRLELLARVCDAVQHAHQKGVIHRDLKPANVLVVSQRADHLVTTSSTSTIDAIGLPKVLDFGIARMTDADVHGATRQTEVGQLIGTLAYMSPEQVRGDSNVLDTRCDVYALGVMLYELLAGERPHDLTGLPAPEAARRVQDTDPTRLGVLVPALRGDVETIVAKALEKDRDRRYGSPLELAADIRRYLQFQPIEARPASALYQLSRFARRNRGMVGGMLTAVVAMIAGLIASGYYLVEAREQRNNAVEARDIAVKAREEADQVVSFQAAQLADINPTLMGRQLEEDLLAALPDDQHHETADSLKQINFTDLSLAILQTNIFDRSLTAIHEHFDDNPSVQARLLITLGQTAEELGMLDVAELPLRQAVAIREESLGPEHVDTLTARSILGGLLVDLGHVKEAEALLQTTFARGVQDYDQDNPNWDTWAANLMKLHFEERRFAEAEALQRERIERLLQTTPVNQSALLKARETLAGILLQQDEPQVLEEAESLLKGAYEAHLESVGPKHQRTLWVQATLAVLLRRQGRLEEALPLSESVWQARQEILGTDHLKTLSSGSNLATLYYRAGRKQEAIDLVHQILDARRRVLGEEHLDYIIALENLATFQDGMDEPSEAGRSFQDAIALRRRVFGSDHPETLLSIKHLGDKNVEWGHAKAAIPLYVEALAGAIGYFGPDHQNTQSVLTTLLTAADYHDSDDQIADHFETAIQIAEKLFGDEHAHTLAIYAGYCALLVKSEQWEAAHAKLTELQERQQRAFPTKSDAIQETERLLVMTQDRLEEQR